ATAGTETQVYTLSVGAPHTFIADGFVVHNKGGGGFHGGSHYSGGASGGGNGDPWVMIWIFVIAVAILAVHDRVVGRKSEDLDFLYEPRYIQPKSEKTAKLLA